MFCSTWKIKRLHPGRSWCVASGNPTVYRELPPAFSLLNEIAGTEKTLAHASNGLGILFRFAQQDHGVSPRNNKQPIARLYTKRIPNLTRDDDLIFG
jgi:hypothetical protein